MKNETKNIKVVALIDYNQAFLLCMHWIIIYYYEY